MINRVSFADSVCIIIGFIPLLGIIILMLVRSASDVYLERGLGVIVRVRGVDDILYVGNEDPGLSGCCH